ncbi:MAG TPA: hypothetical protein VMJ64_05360 [Anaerolineales bacterium]|nr:hypothetical protein [Anaerolineales bacterium]
MSAMWHTVNTRQAILKLFLGLGIGLGATSLLFFAWLLLTHQARGFEWALMGLLAVWILAKLFRRGSRQIRIRMPGVHYRGAWIGLALSVAFAATLLLSCSSFVMYSLTRPHGDRDAQAIWNLRARVIYRDTSNWTRVFSPEFDSRFHADYPLLIPLNDVWGWEFLNRESTGTPIVLASLFTYGTICLAFAALINLKTWGQASLASLVLMGTPFFFSLGAYQIADIPLSYFILSTIVLLALYGIQGERTHLALAGLAAGLAAWTKNEGDFFILAVLAGCTVYGLLQRQVWRTLGTLAAGMAAPIVMVLYYKATLAPPNDLFVGFNLGEALRKLVSLQRYEIIFAAIGKALLNFGNWRVSIVIVLAIFSIVVGMRMERPQRRVAAVCTIVLALQLLGYIFIYAITPVPLEYHLQYSLDRLLFQLFPAALVLVFWSLATPEDIIPNHLPSKPQKTDAYASNR